MEGGLVVKSAFPATQSCKAGIALAQRAKWLKTAFWGLKRAVCSITQTTIGEPMIKRTERGWAGHFIGSESCSFRRNTLIESNNNAIVVSTVGGYRPNNKTETIGSNGRYYETMAFYAKQEESYLEADVSREIGFDSQWALCYDSSNDIPDDVDNIANQMHENVVNELMLHIQELK